MIAKFLFRLPMKWYQKDFGIEAQIILSHLDRDSARKMKYFIFLLCISWIEAKEEALPGEFPWSVSLELDPQQGYFGHDCGGAILDEVPIWNYTQMVSKSKVKYLYLSELDYYHCLLCSIEWWVRSQQFPCYC